MFGFGKKSLGDVELYCVTIRVAVLIWCYEEEHRVVMPQNDCQKWVDFSFNEIGLRPSSEEKQLVLMGASALAGEGAWYCKEFFSRGTNQVNDADILVVEKILERSVQKFRASQQR